jgi:hypothetical protein
MQWPDCPPILMLLQIIKIKHSNEEQEIRMAALFFNICVSYKRIFLDIKEKVGCIFYVFSL